MFEMKTLSHGAVDAAMKKAVHYRLLNQPLLAESICRDVLTAEPGHQEAVVTLLLSLCDQFGMGGGANYSAAMELLPSVEGDYERSYYTGIVCERRAFAALATEGHASGHIAYDWLRRAMEHYEAALPLRSEGNDDAILRWNTCARVINTRSDVHEAHDHAPGHSMLE